MKIVLTGGPSAGKTAITEVLSRTYCDQLCMAPEAASILFRGGFPRSVDGQGMRSQQLAIYYVQRELEQVVSIQSGKQNVICDRGSLDGLAYWPGDKNEFFKAINSDQQLELQRYDWVLHLDTASKFSYSASSLRVESHNQAELINSSIKEAWGSHPRQIVVSNATVFDKKISKVISIVDMILKGATILEIRQAIKEHKIC